MLPGFRFLFAAIVLSMSILVFGLGAAALFRAAHEQFASNPSWRAPEAMLAQQPQTTRPVLAILQVQPAIMDQKPPADVPAVVAPAGPATDIAAPAEETLAPAEPSQIAALKPEETAQPEPAKPETPALEGPAPGEAATAPSETSASSGAANIAAPDADKLASTEPVSPSAQDPPPATKAAPVASEPAASEPAASEQASIPAPPEHDAASTRIATLGGPAVVIEAPAEAASDRPDRNAVKKRQQARRTAHRRRLVARAHLAARQAQPANPFAQSPAPARNL